MAPDLGGEADLEGGGISPTWPGTRRELLRVLKKGLNPQEEKSDLHEEKINPQEEKKNPHQEKN